MKSVVMQAPNTSQVNANIKHHLNTLTGLQESFHVPVTMGLLSIKHRTM
jgi:hypothetical protein